MSSPIKQYFPQLLVGLSISLIMAGAYLAVGYAASSVPKALWSENPISISFSGSGGSGSFGSVGDSLKCAPNVQDVSLKTSVSNPVKISLTTSFAPGGSCGPPFAAVTITAHCLVFASTCRGTYFGTVAVIRGYLSLPPSLSVAIVVS